MGGARFPVPDSDFLLWAEWYESADRVVKQERVLAGLVEVSTVFLGIDHSGFWGDGTPVLFETMAFWPSHDAREQTRACTLGGGGGPT